MTKHYLSKPLDQLELGVGEFICVEQWCRFDKEWPRARFERPLTDLRLHDDVDALDFCSKWWEGTVVQIKQNESGETSVLVHFTGWSAKYDEWYDLSQPHRIEKLARCGTHTAGAYNPAGLRQLYVSNMHAIASESKIVFHEIRLEWFFLSYIIALNTSLFPVWPFFESAAYRW